MKFLQGLLFTSIGALCFIFCSADDSITTTISSTPQFPISGSIQVNDQDPHVIEPRVVQKRSDGSIECTGAGCKPKQKSPKLLSKRSNSSSSSEEKRKNKKKKCKHCEERKRRMTNLETETENQQNIRLQGHIKNNPDIKKQECTGEGCTPSPRFERSASKSKSNSKSKEDDEYSDEDKEEDGEDDDDLYSDEKPKKKKKVVKKPPPKTTKLQDLFTHFNG